MGKKGEITFLSYKDPLIINFNYFIMKKFFITIWCRFMTEEQEAKFLYALAVKESKSYCYYSEDADGKPTIAICGNNVFSIVQDGTDFHERRVNVTEAMGFISNIRDEYIKNNFRVSAR